MSSAHRPGFHPWSEFEAGAPELAAFGRARLDSEAPSYLATVRRDELPRVHPVGAKVKAGRLALYMYPTSPKGKDLVADGRYALHCNVSDNQGGGGEFYVRGYAIRVDSSEHQALVAEAGFPPKNGFDVFELGVDEAFSCTYDESTERPVIQRWQRRS
jgi:hypothetical protein